MLHGCRKKEEKGELPSASGEAPLCCIFLSTKCTPLGRAETPPTPSVQMLSPNPSFLHLLSSLPQTMLFPSFAGCSKPGPCCCGLGIAQPGQSTRARQPLCPVPLLALLAGTLVCFLELPSVMKLEGHHHLARLPPTPKINN